MRQLNEVQGAVETAFKRLIAEKPYRSITVKEICSRAYVSRRTFYVNFADKDAIVAQLYQRDAIEPIMRVIEMLSADEAVQMATAIISRFYRGIYDEREYYANLVRSMGTADPTFRQVVTDAALRFIEWCAERVENPIEGDDVQAIAFYHASAQAPFLEKWIAEGFAMPIERMAQIQVGMIMPSLKQAVFGCSEHAS